MIIKNEVLAGEARKLIDFHGDDWDQPHAFMTLHPDGNGGLRPGAWTAIMLDVPPVALPGLIARVAAGQAAEHPEDPAYAYGFLMEGFGMTEPAASAGKEERERFTRARETRTIYQQPEAVECALAWVADIHGGVWCCQRTRGTGDVRESFYRPGKALGGAIIDALVAVARVTRVASWNLALD